MTYAYRSNPLPSDPRVNGPRLILMKNVVEQLTHVLPRFVAGTGHENVAYLGGFDLGQDRVACSVLMPRANTAPGSYDTDIASHAAVIRSLADFDFEIIGQIHTHPGSAVYHSDGDDDLAFVKGEGFWSIVVPDYARNGLVPLSQCGFHLFTTGAFHLLTTEAASARVDIQPSFLDLR